MFSQSAPVRRPWWEKSLRFQSRRSVCVCCSLQSSAEWYYGSLKEWPEGVVRGVAKSKTEFMHFLVENWSSRVDLIRIIFLHSQLLSSPSRMCVVHWKHIKPTSRVRTRRRRPTRLVRYDDRLGPWIFSSNYIFLPSRPPHYARSGPL